MLQFACLRRLARSDQARAILHPWRVAQEAVRLVEPVLARSPAHPQAAHLYIRLMENGLDPQAAEAAADRLNAPLAPKSGHLVHMPSHIYYAPRRYWPLQEP